MKKVEIYVNFKVFWVSRSARRWLNWSFQQASVYMENSLMYRHWGLTLSFEMQSRTFSKQNRWWLSRSLHICVKCPKLNFNCIFCISLNAHRLTVVLCDHQFVMFFDYSLRRNQSAVGLELLVAAGSHQLNFMNSLTRQLVGYFSWVNSFSTIACKTCWI